MKLNTLLKKNAVCEYWDFTETQRPEGTLIEYFLSDPSLELTIIPAHAGGMYAIADFPMRMNSQLHDVKDKAGNFIFYENRNGEPYEVVVSTVTPLFDGFGNVDKYYHELTREFIANNFFPEPLADGLGTY